MSRIRKELEAIQNADPDRMIHPPKVVDWARRHKTSALHHSLEWNDSKAAEEYRLSQVRHLVQVYIISGDGRPLVVSLKRDRVAGGGYRPIENVISRRDLMRELLDEAMREFDRVRERYEWLKALEPVWDEVEKVKATRKRRSPPEPRASA